MIKKDPELVKKGFLQALGVTTYCSLVGLFFWKAESIFGKMDNRLAPVVFLLLFIMSALTCALIVFYHPYKLFFDNKKDKAVNLIIFTTGWLAGFFAFFLLLTLLF